MLSYNGYALSYDANGNLVRSQRRMTRGLSALPGLIELASGIGQDEMAERFRIALEEEDEHLQSVRTWLTQEAELGATRAL